MKLEALQGRDTKRDFIDLFLLAKEFPIDQIFEFYNKRYGIPQDRLYHIIKSMSYFDDADNDYWVPKMLIPLEWEDVKMFFRAEAKRLAKEKLEIGYAPAQYPPNSSPP